MSEQTDSELAYSLEGALEPLGAQWAVIEAAILPFAESRAQAFGEQLAEIERLVRLEVAENERLRALNTEMREALADFDALATLQVPEGFEGLWHIAQAKARAILAKTESR